MPTATSPGYAQPGGTPIVPQYRFKGNYWSFGVQFIDPATGAPVPLDASHVPGAEFFHAYTAGPALDLTVANGLVTVTDAPNGKVAYFVPESVTTDAIAQSVAPVAGTRSYPTRLQCFLTDGIGRQTYVIVGIVPIDPRTTDLSTIPPAMSIVAYAGPAGPPATDAQVAAAVAAYIAENPIGPVVPIPGPSSPGGGPSNTADFSDPNNAYLAGAL